LGWKALVTIDQNRRTVVDRIVGQWGDALAGADTMMSSEQLRTLLMSLRADHLLAASLARDLDALQNTLASAITSTADVKAGLIQTKAPGDTGDELGYTPV